MGVAERGMISTTALLQIPTVLQCQQADAMESILYQVDNTNYGLCDAPS